MIAHENPYVLQIFLRLLQQLYPPVIASFCHWSIIGSGSVHWSFIPCLWVSPLIFFSFLSEGYLCKCDKQLQ